jgi:hypothetical protein
MAVVNVRHGAVIEQGLASLPFEATNVRCDANATSGASTDREHATIANPKVRRNI